jgi:hypothetical protein
MQKRLGVLVKWYSVCLVSLRNRIKPQYCPPAPQKTPRFKEHVFLKEKKNKPKDDENRMI